MGMGGVEGGKTWSWRKGRGRKVGVDMVGEEVKEEVDFGERGR